MIALLVFLFSISAFGQGAHASRPKLCDEVVTTMYPEWISRIPRPNMRKVEVRNCRIGDWGFLQIAAWPDRGEQPSLLVETNRSTIVKIAMAGNVFVLETAGASSNVVQVVTYDKGTPRLVLSDAIKAYARIDMSWKKVVVALPQQKGPERVYEFPTGEN